MNEEPTWGAQLPAATSDRGQMPAPPRPRTGPLRASPAETLVRHADHYRECARLLNWAGVVLPRPDPDLCDTPLVPVVVLDWAAHRERVARGFGPETNRDRLASWKWGELVGRTPRPAVHLTGALFDDQNSRRWWVTFAQAASWRDFGPTAVCAVGAADDIEIERRQKHRHLGVGLTLLPTPSSGPPNTRWPEHVQGSLLEPATPGRRPGTVRRVADRWLEEALYELALASGCFDHDPDTPGSASSMGRASQPARDERSPRLLPPRPGV